MASSTCTCNTRWLPPFKSSPSLMRSARLAFTCVTEVGKRRQSQKSIQANQNYDEYENELPSDLGIHAGCLTLLRWFYLHSRDRVAGHFHLHLLGDAQLHRVAFKANNRAIDSAVGDDFISVLQSPQHFVHFLLPPLRRQYHQKVKNYHDQDQRQE